MRRRRRRRRRIERRENAYVNKQPQGKGWRTWEEEREKEGACGGVQFNFLVFAL